MEPAVDVPVAQSRTLLSVRLFILLIIAAALAVALGVCATRPPSNEIEGQVFLPPAGFDDIDIETMRRRQGDLAYDDAGAEELDPPPEFEVEVEVDPTGKKNRLLFHIREVHGYYAEQLSLKVWYKPGPGPVPEDWAPLVTHPVYKYIKAGETLTDCLELVKFEVDLIGGSLGNDENWYAEVSDYGKALEQNPDQFPALPQGMDRCTPFEP